MDATGERFIPEAMGGQLIEAEHHARYRFAAEIVADKDVLDAGCGVGWGSSLLLAAGARSVVGVDISLEAVEDARLREPGARFDVGDMCDVALASKSFDIITCFEALEHVGDHEQALDNLVRMLRPGGLLVVSSPNPGIYPPGNEFHVHELAPDELRRELARRLGHTALWRQYPLVASALLPDDSPAGPLSARVTSVGEVGPGRDPYSLVVASSAPLPALNACVVVCPDDQLQHLAAASEAVEAARHDLAAEHGRLADERREILVERQRLLDQLVQAGESLQEKERDIGRLTEIAAQRDRLQSELDGLRAVAEHGERLQSATDLAIEQRDHRKIEPDRVSIELAAHITEKDRLTAELDRVRHLLAERDESNRLLRSARVPALLDTPMAPSERDRIGLMLLQSEQRVAQLVREAESLRLGLERALGTAQHVGERPAQ